MDLFGCWHQGLAVTNSRIDDPKHTRRPGSTPLGKKIRPTAMRQLTDLQRATLDWIRQYVRSHGIAPTRAEIAAGTGVKHQSVIDQRLLALERKGWIELKPASARYIRLLDEDLPLIVAGRVAAGEPIVAEERIQKRIPRSVGEVFKTRAGFFSSASRGTR